MPKYVHKQLLKYKHTTPKRKQNCPYSPNPIKYGAKIQAPTAPDESPPLSKEDHKYIQQVVGSFLFYARAIDNTILIINNFFVFFLIQYWSISESQILLLYVVKWKNIF